MFRFILSTAALVAATTAFAHPQPPLAPFAATAAKAQNVTELGPIVVTAPTGTPQPLDATLAPVIVIGADTLKSFGSADIASVLKFYAGLDIARNGGPGQPASLFLRGTGSAQTLVLVDGVPVNSGDTGGAPLDNITAASVERVEVVEAPRSALYGSEAIGGVVSITLKQPPRKGFDWGATIGGGHYSSRSAGGYAGGGNGTFFSGADVNWFETAGFPPLTASDNASAYRNQTIHTEFGVRNDSSEAYATFWRSAGTSDYLDFFLNPASEDYVNRVAALHFSSRISDAWRSRVILGQFFEDIQQVQTPDYTHTWRNSIDWRNDVAVGDYQLVSAGVYLTHEHVNALSYGTGYDEITRTRALYAQDQIHFGAHRIVIAGRESHFSDFGDQFTWNADYGFSFSKDWRLTAGAGTGFRAPTATDLYGYGGNPDLRPEYSHGINAGLYRQVGTHALVGLNLYRNRISDLITFEATSTGGQEENIGQATITGVNLSARLVYGPWHIEPAVNIQRPLNDETGGYLPRRSRRSISLNLGYDTGRWRIGAHFLAAGPSKDSDFSNATNAGYLLTDLTAGYAFAAHWRLGARVENLFDVNYQTAAGYASPGRGLYLALSYEM